MSNLNFTSFQYSVADVIKGLAILKFVTSTGVVAGYTVGQGGKSFSKLSAARAYARRIGNAFTSSNLYFN